MLVWMDLEMTGLDPVKEVIVEIATLVTDDQLEIVAEGPDLVVHQPEDVLAAMDPYVVEMHTRSGLLEAIRASTITPRRGRRRHPGLHPRARARARQGAALRQLHRHRPSLPRRLPPRDRAVPALPLRRRVEREGAREALVPRAGRAATARRRAATGPSTTSARASTSCASTASTSSCRRRCRCCPSPPRPRRHPTTSPPHRTAERCEHHGAGEHDEEEHQQDGVDAPR